MGIVLQVRHPVFGYGHRCRKETTGGKKSFLSDERFPSGALGMLVLWVMLARRERARIP